MQAVTIDRDKYIGGSDIPVIMGISPFKTRFDLLLEKAGLKENNFNGNEYTEYGNILEPKIRDYINHDRSDKFEEGKYIENDIRCHTDGINSDTVLEIKTTSQVHDTIDDYKVYLIQLLFYMQYTKRDYGKLAVYDRPDDFNEEFDKKRLQLFDIKLNDYQDLLDQINNAVEHFRIDLVKVKENPFITEEDLQPTELIETSNELLDVEEQLKFYDELVKKQKELKSKLKESMEKYGIKKWTTNSGTQITLIPDSEDKLIFKFNEDKFKEENQDLYLKYIEEKIQKGKAGYLKITMPK